MCGDCFGVSRRILSLLLLLASSCATEALGIHALFGAFVAGLVMPHGTDLPKVVEPLTSTLLLPLFFAFTGLRISIALVSGAKLWLYCAAIMAVAISGKLLGLRLHAACARPVVGRIADRGRSGQHARFDRTGGLKYRSGSEHHFAYALFDDGVDGARYYLHDHADARDDPSRVGSRVMSQQATYWAPAMTESQCAVFHFDVKTMSMREGDDVPLIFSSLDEAERYSRGKIAEASGVGCQIYDRGGRIIGTFADSESMKGTMGSLPPSGTCWQGLHVLLPL